MTRKFEELKEEADLSWSQLHPEYEGTSISIKNEMRDYFYVTKMLRFVIPYVTSGELKGNQLDTPENIKTIIDEVNLKRDRNLLSGFIYSLLLEAIPEEELLIMTTDERLKLLVSLIRKEDIVD